MIRNIIFDLGGVIIDINSARTSEAFRRLGAINLDAVYTQSKQDNLFDFYDVGKISSREFRDALVNRLDLAASDDEFDTAWNAMLGDLPIERLNFIRALRSSYRVLLFSNTNEIHLKEVFNICQQQNGFSSFNDFFDKEYYSHTFGQRKPNPDSFKAILAENGMNQEETLFIDDSLQHVLGARSAGLHAVHLSGDLLEFDLNAVIEQINQTQIQDQEHDRQERYGSFA